jgi:hypothetical protein
MCKSGRRERLTIIGFMWVEKITTECLLQSINYGRWLAKVIICSNETDFSWIRHTDSIPRVLFSLSLHEGVRYFFSLRINGGLTWCTVLLFPEVEWGCTWCTSLPWGWMRGFNLMYLFSLGLNEGVPGVLLFSDGWMRVYLVYFYSLRLNEGVHIVLLFPKVEWGWTWCTSIPLGWMSVYLMYFYSLRLNEGVPGVLLFP